MVFSRKIQLIDEYLGVPKKLADGIPVWEKSSWKNELQAIWLIDEEDGSTRSQLRFKTRVGNRKWPSVSLIFRNDQVCRVDLAPDHIVKRNPPWAIGVGLPAKISGSHIHAWNDNKEHIRSSNVWEISARRNLKPQISRLPHALAYLADEIKLDLTNEQRQFDIPPQSDLFDLE